MKTFLKVFGLMFLVVTMSVGMSSCGPDELDSDLASQIQGTYVGQGQLEMVGITGIPLEEYPGMKILVTKSSNEFVILTPYTADGKPFYSGGSGDVFQITQTVNKDFMLTSTSIPNSRVTITRSKSMSFYYPYVSVGGEGGYALSFSGTRQ